MLSGWPLYSHLRLRGCLRPRRSSLPYGMGDYYSDGNGSAKQTPGRVWTTKLRPWIAILAILSCTVIALCYLGECAFSGLVITIKRDDDLEGMLLLPKDFEMDNRQFSVEFAQMSVPFNMTSENACSEAVRLLIFVPTRPSAFEARNAIRESWARDMPPDVAVRFVVGSPEDLDVFELLMGERKEHKDLILNSLDDTYKNLFLKINAAFQWQQAFCPSARYVLKTDDDTVVDVNRLKYWIDRKFNDIAKRPTIFGGIWRRAKPTRDKAHKWYVSEDVYPHRFFPPYMNGPTYLLTSDAVAAILKHTREVKAFPIEDILYTGVLASHAGVMLTNSWDHFRNSNRVQGFEDCGEGSVPFVTSMYGFSDPAYYQQAYDGLRKAGCKKHRP